MRGQAVILAAALVLPPEPREQCLRSTSRPKARQSRCSFPELRIVTRKLVDGSAMEIRKYDGGKCTKAADYTLIK
jgi:hypothetical protein